MIARIFQSQPSGRITCTVEGLVDTFESLAALAGFECIGYLNNHHNRAELQGKPVFKGILGPIWDGPGPDGSGVIRYECPETYKTLST